MLSHSDLRGRVGRQPWWVAGGYGAAALAYIALSDRALAALVHDPETLVAIGTYKGFAFVAFTAALLFALVRRWAGLVERSLASVARRAEAEAVAERERGFSQSLVEAVPGILYLYDESGRFLRWNEGFERATGYSADEIASMHPLQFFGPDDQGLVEERIDEVFRQGSSNVEARLRTKGGAHIPYLFTGRRIELEGKQYLVGVGVDLSDQRRAQEALAHSEDRYKNTLDSMLEGCQLLDAEWRYLYLNEAAAKQNRRTADEILGKRMQDAWPGIEESHIFGLLRRCMEERVAVQGETEFHFEDRVTRWFEVRAQPVAEGGLSVLSIDITERKRALAKLRELNEELERKVADRTAELERARERAESADRTKSAFLATMSHELRTPLNSIMGFTGILLQGLAGPLGDEQQKQMGMVQRSARHLLALINDVLDISKIEAGQLEVRCAPFALMASVERVVEGVQVLAEEKGLRVRLVRPPSPLAPLTSDQRRVEQILLNLLTNAIKFTESGEVTATVMLAAPEGGGGSVLRLMVADSGIGIDADDLQTLFQPFRQLDSGLQRHHEGTGLGLAISRRLAVMLGGTLSATSVLGEGSVFTLELPYPEQAPAPVESSS